MVDSQTDPSPSVSTEGGSVRLRDGWVGGWVEGVAVRDIDGERESERDRATPEG